MCRWFTFQIVTRIKSNYRTALWRQCLHVNNNSLSLTNYGWKCEDQRLIVQWYAFPTTLSTLSNLVKWKVRRIAVTPGVVYVFVKSCLVLAFASVCSVLIYLKKIGIIKWKILTPQRINNIRKNELVGSEESKLHFISFLKSCVPK